ncbi:ABC transporter substrate-binding protein [Balneolaceae bacterium ANBcel3]|nr:ABC transporter substrate-binding protein [Balneolaceae bacterium ANBcel3]
MRRRISPSPGYRKSSRFSWLLYVVAPLLLFSVSCSSTETIVVGDQARSVETEDTRETEPQKEIVLKIGDHRPISSFDPLFALNTSDRRVIGLIYEGLVRFNEQENVVPALAKKWEISEDSLTYTFTLRRSAFYHDDESFLQGRGRRIHSNDVLKVFERMASRDVPPDAAELFRETILGFDAFFLEQREVYLPRKRQMETIPGIEVLSDSTIAFHLFDPDPEFLYKLASPYAVIYPEEPFRFRDSGLHTRAVGSGPFRHHSSIGDSIHIFLRNDYYPHFSERENDQYVQRIELLNTENETRLYSLFTRNKLDILFDLGPQSIQTIINEEHTLVEELRLFYSVLAVPNPEPLIAYYNHRNRYGLTMKDASASLRNVQQDTLRALSGNPSLTVEFLHDEYSTLNVANVFRTFGHGQRFRLITAYNQGLHQQTISSLIHRLFASNLDTAIMQRPVFSRDMFIYLDEVPVFVPGKKVAPKDHEVFRMYSYRYIMYNNSISGIKTNGLAWWIDLSGVR